jgi:hypothetical protein
MIGSLPIAPDRPAGGPAAGGNAIALRVAGAIRAASRTWRELIGAAGLAALLLTAPTATSLAFELNRFGPHRVAIDAGGHTEEMWSKTFWRLMRQPQASGSRPGDGGPVVPPAPPPAASPTAPRVAAPPAPVGPLPLLPAPGSEPPGGPDAACRRFPNLC